MQYRALEDLFTGVVVRGRAELAQEQREPAPMLAIVTASLGRASANRRISPYGLLTPIGCHHRFVLPTLGRANYVA